MFFFAKFAKITCTPQNHLSWNKIFTLKCLTDPTPWLMVSMANIQTDPMTHGVTAKNSDQHLESWCQCQKFRPTSWLMVWMSKIQTDTMTHGVDANNSDRHHDSWCQCQKFRPTPWLMVSMPKIRIDTMSDGVDGKYSDQHHDWWCRCQKFRQWFWGVHVILQILQKKTCGVHAIFAPFYQNDVMSYMVFWEALTPRVMVSTSQFSAVLTLVFGH